MFGVSVRFELGWRKDRLSGDENKTGKRHSLSLRNNQGLMTVVNEKTIRK
jgi:hypothetical protein